MGAPGAGAPCSPDREAVGGLTAGFLGPVSSTLLGAGWRRSQGSVAGMGLGSPASGDGLEMSSLGEGQVEGR